MKKFLHRIWVVLRSYFMGVGILVTLFSILLSYMIAKELKPESGGQWSDSPKSLLLELKGNLIEGSPDKTDLLLAEWLGEEQGVYLGQLREALRKAAKDKNVEELNVQLGAFDASMSDIVDLRRTLLEFRKSGKSVTFAADGFNSWEYFLATAASRIIISPAAEIGLPGPVFELMYFGDAVRRIGVDIEVFRAGKYKSAFEPFVQNTPSPETLEQYEAMEAKLRDYLVTEVATARGVAKETVAAWFKQSIFTVKDAIDQKLVDSVGYGPVLSGQMPVTSYEPASILDSVSSESSGIGLIEAVGEIVMDAGSDEEAIDPDSMAEELAWARDDNEVKAVVLRISSPGGVAVAADRIWAEVKATAEIKPLIVSMGEYAASGGYYIAAPARRIFAEPTTITGSIGVIGMQPSFGQFEEKYGISFHAVTQTDRKNLYDRSEKSTAFDKALVESTIDQIYAEFLDKVSSGRGLPVETVAKLAQGRVYTGIEGVENGLVDELGGLRDAIRYAKTQGGLNPDQLYPLHRFERDRSRLSRCLRSPWRCVQARVVNSEMPKGMRRLLRQKDLLTQGRALSLWPHTLRW